MCSKYIVIFWRLLYVLLDLYFKDTVNLWYHFKFATPILHNWKMEAAAVSASLTYKRQHTSIVVNIQYIDYFISTSQQDSNGNVIIILHHLKHHSIPLNNILHICYIFSYIVVTLMQIIITSLVSASGVFGPRTLVPVEGRHNIIYT